MFQRDKDPKKEKRTVKVVAMPIEEGDYYLNESGLMVFTAQYHLRRGYCCGSKCKHCPYNWENVPGSDIKPEND
jgi:hypothetical protein